MRLRAKPTKRLLTAVLPMCLLLLALPLGPAQATDAGTLNVEPEIQNVLQGSAVTLTATLSVAPTRSVFIDFENEGGPNDPDPQPGTSYQTPDRTCEIPAGAVSCTTQAYNANRVTTNSTGGAAPDVWRAWIDHDQSGTAAATNGNTTTEADTAEGRDENTTPGNGNALLSQCSANTTVEPDCTDVVEVRVGALEVVPDLQTLDSGSTARLTARLFGPTQDPNGTNIDFEAETSGSTYGANDPDTGNSYTTPDATCTVPFGETECFVEYVGNNSGTDQWRAWIDYDKTQTTTEADLAEGRYSDDPDCQNPEDPSNCVGNVQGVENPSPGNGCNPNNTNPPPAPNRSEPDCTDVVQVTFRPGPPATLDCDDQSGTQTATTNPDTERETNPRRPSPNRPETDPSTERYQCRVRTASGGGVNGVRVNAEVENGINDPDSPDGASYNSPDYACTTTFDEDDPTIVLAPSGFCYISILQDELELGTAEICFWVGTAAEGAALCADEPTGESQLANGNDTPNDLADQVEKTWADPATLRLDCEPESGTGPAGSTHEVTCTVTAPSGATVGGVDVDAEATGASDPDSSDSPLAPDFTCRTADEGRCSFTHTSSSEGRTQYRAWIDADGSNTTNESDGTEGVNEDTSAGARAEPDNTDVMEMNWGPRPTTVTMTPENDSAPVGECNPYTITLTASNGAPVANAVVDVEQRHALADNQTAGDEPTVSFCEPPESGGPNGSQVDESRGDLGSGPNQESPDNRGTAGGETVGKTDSNGKITIGIRVAPGNGSNGAGGVSIVAWWESTDNDDPDSAEPKDSSTKTWTPAGGEPGVPAGVSLSPTSSVNEPGERVTYTATVNDANGDPVEGATVTWTEDGEGEFVSQESTTDAAGRARAVVTSNNEGTQVITATASDCVEGAQCEDSSNQAWEEGMDCPGFEGDSRNQIVGTPGNDTLRGTDGDDIICGLGGKDTIIGAGGDDVLLGGGGNDILRGNAGKDNLRGQSGEDTLAGGGGNDRHDGGGDDDIIRGGGGNDIIIGRGGKDVLRGRGGNDRLKGNAGDDSLGGGRGDDFLDGGDGTDICNGGPGRDQTRRCE